ncbi:MAG: M1 family metallopeptidase [Schleiferiaceae bacterium]|nr:M1 family metallopeptidase [Schleiferiaceae bacterium]
MTAPILAQSVPFERINTSKFRQLAYELPTPNEYRTASGAPGHAYYQNQANYNMTISLNEKEHKINGNEWITYINNSPDDLQYLWVQLDQNIRKPGSMTDLISKSSLPSSITPADVSKNYIDQFDGGFKITKVKDQSGNDLKHTIVNTMMRIDLTSVLKSGNSIKFNIGWNYTINNRMEDGGRSGYEYFEEEDNTLYTIAQFFPRMAVYGDDVGWQHKQFLGQGEFTLPFGNYRVSIDVPEDHIVAATGELVNESTVLSSTQRKRLAEARKNFSDPVMIVTQEEAEIAERAESKESNNGRKTWIFNAKKVRDFAFATSRKFIWDVMAVKIGDKTVTAESFYPKEGNPLWEQYSTRVVAHSLISYSKHTVDYTYPRAISVHTNQIGMEYPMICFNGGRPEKDGTYSEATKYGMIGVIIHEVGHNFFPMIINSDERQWTWMDEGLNTFVQYLCEQEWDVKYPSRRGPAYQIVDYMRSPALNIVPIMTNSESILQFGNNAYAKPATALNILRETVLGRELFDYAFKIYCERWAFKHPAPADLFRTIEDASGVDLDWFWRGWFYSTEYVDLNLSKVRIAQVPTIDPDELENQRRTKFEKDKKRHIGRIRNQKELPPTVVDRVAETNDFYNSYDRYKLNSREQKKLSRLKDKRDGYLHELTISNDGGLISPIVLGFTFKDGTRSILRYPAEIWIQNEKNFTKTVYFPKKAIKIEIDPFLELADCDTYNNVWPRQVEIHLEALPQKNPWENDLSNPMRNAQSNNPD